MQKTKKVILRRLKLLALVYILGSTLVFICAKGIGGYSIIVNRTSSVDGLFFLLNKNNRQPQHNKLMAFYAPENPYYTNNRKFMKYVWGINGDKVSFGGKGELYINGKKRGYVKNRTLNGEPIARSKEGIIGKNQVFFGTTHKDSFDSRYKLVGNIYEKDIIGTANRLF